MHRSLAIDHQARAITWERTEEDCATALVLLADPDCSLATASYLFWAVQPLDYLTRNLDEPCEHGGANTPWTVIREAVRGAQLRRFPNAVAYDPCAEWQTESASPPGVVVRPSLGAEPVLWRDAKEIEDLWDTELAAEIAGAADAEELFNIVQHLDEPEPLELVLSSVALDQGTALLVYWRLRNISGLWRAASEIMACVEQIIAAGTLPAVLAYDPAADPENKELHQRARWSVPEVFMQPTHG